MMGGLPPLILFNRNKTPPCLSPTNHDIINSPHKEIMIKGLMVRSVVGLAVLGLLLSACSTPQVKNPAKELCSGTKRPYEINGKMYYPQDHFDYEEDGLASWYGPGFDGQPKSCGGRYNMHGLSAAHKTLPIPSVVEVTNIENGKKIKLVVDDRGPFVDARIIDLSKGAAHALDVHHRGLAKVRVRAIPEESVALVNHLKQYGRYGQPSDGRSWDAIYREHIADKHHDIDQEPPHLEVAVARSDTPKPAKIQPAVARIEKSKPLPRPERATYVKESAADFDNLLQEISTAPMKKKAPAQPPKTSVVKSHYVHVGNFIQKQNAEKLRRELAHHGQAYVAETKASGQRFYAVKLGPYQDHNQAKKILTTLSNDGHYAVVHNY